MIVGPNQEVLLVCQDCDQGSSEFNDGWRLVHLRSSSIRSSDAGLRASWVRGVAMSYDPEDSNSSSFVMNPKKWEHTMFTASARVFQ